MRGRVLGVDARTGEGQVAGDDGRRYAFSPQDWAARGEPAIGIEVDFEAADNRALSVFPMPNQPLAATAPVAAPPAAAPRPNPRNRFIAALIAFFIGSFGIHRFYLGRKGSGIVMLVLTLTVVGAAISVPWSWIDMIRYLLMSDREFDRRYAPLD